MVCSFCTALRIVHCVLGLAYCALRIGLYSVFFTFPPSTTLKHLLQGRKVFISKLPASDGHFSLAWILSPYLVIKYISCIAWRLRFMHGWHTTSLYRQQSAVIPITTVMRLKARLLNNNSQNQCNPVVPGSFTTSGTNAPMRLYPQVFHASYRAVVLPDVYP